MSGASRKYAIKGIWDVVVKDEFGYKSCRDLNANNTFCLSSGNHYGDITIFKLMRDVHTL